MYVFAGLKKDASLDDHLKYNDKFLSPDVFQWESIALMKQAAKDLDFMQAAQYRDEIIRLQKELEEK